MRDEDCQLAVSDTFGGVPPGATIMRAYVQLRADKWLVGDDDQAEDGVNPATYRTKPG